ncbi:hypothetical protein HRI_001879200 [Hibiscus trionum]|uniref:RRM domain-containing protein n=1 Tax=Hibiscus trionum TaxID=183268 RepID=A0A9W7LYX5_HIBTR|nr:hypothetical protein HRI_001879200 [Hibiscus trionum]
MRSRSRSSRRGRVVGGSSREWGAGVRRDGSFYGGGHGGHGEVREQWVRRSGRSSQSAPGYSQPRKNAVRPGFAVFVNFVSKRIHVNTLRKAFELYGAVIDVYIAYHSPKRYKVNHTFAFVRFSNLEEAKKAADLGNNRRLDGYFIKVFLEQSLLRAGHNDQNMAPSRNSSRKQFSSAVMAGRSFKDALLGEGGRKGRVSSQWPKEASRCSQEWSDCPRVSGVIPIRVNISESEFGWLKSCLVGQVNEMYDATFVDQVLRSEGFNVNVCHWSGHFVILKFVEEEQVSIFWDLKETMLKSWFRDIDTIDNFMNSKKLLIWVCLEGIPLVGWHETVLSSIVNSWGRYIRLDEDTKDKKRLDVARILVGVSCLSDIPPFVSVDFSGDVHRLRVSLSEYEDERVWIDQGDSKSQEEADWDCRYDVNEERDDEVSPKKDGNSIPLRRPNQENGDDTFSSTRALSLDKASNTEYIKEKSEKGCFGSQVSDRPNPSGSLVDVHISNEVGLDLSSGPSISLEPILDESTGLFSIRPKWAAGSLYASSPFRQFGMADKPRGSVGVVFQSKNRQTLDSVVPSKVVALGAVPEEEPASVRPTIRKSKSVEADLEARATVEVCKMSGLSFRVPEVVVIKRLKEIESNAGK